jgi:quercetin dioxygenase-like cupin family protein
MFSSLSIEKDKIFFSKTSDDTNGEYSLLEVNVVSGTGPPMHYHKLLTHTFTVIEGVMYLTVGDKVHVLKAGDIYIVPPGVPHKEESEKGKWVRCTVEIRPAHKGFENFMNMTYNMDVSGLSEEEKKRIYLNADTYMP